MDDFKKLINQLDSLVEDKDTNHELLMSHLEVLIKLVGALIPRLLDSGNKFAAARYSELQTGMVKHLGVLESVRI